MVVCVCFQVMHPKNPMAPTVHFNYRYFETDAPQGDHLDVLHRCCGALAATITVCEDSVHRLISPSWLN